MSNSIRQSKTSSAIQLAEKLAFAMEPATAAEIFLTQCLETVGSPAGAVYLTDPANGKVVACPCSKGSFASEISKEKLEEVCRLQKPKRIQSKQSSYFGVPIKYEKLSLGCLVISSPMKNRKLSSLRELVPEYSLFLARTSGVTREEPANAEETRKLMHDFRNMLAGLSGYAQLMRQQSSQLSPAQIEEYAGIIEKETERLSRIAEDFLHRTKKPAKEEEQERRRPAEILGDLHALMSVDLNQHGIHLLTRIEAEKPIHANSDLLQRALVNLLVNAKEALPAGGVVEIAAEVAGNRTEFRVSDSGPGIPPEIANRIFDANFSHGKQNGYGLGLSIVKEVADIFGGEVRIENSPFGGASIVLSLPS